MNADGFLYALRPNAEKHVPGDLEKCRCNPCVMSARYLALATPEELREFEETSAEKLKDFAVFTLRELHYMLPYVEGFTLHAREVYIRTVLILAILSRKYGV